MDILRDPRQRTIGIVVVSAFALLMLVVVLVWRTQSATPLNPPPPTGTPATIILIPGYGGGTDGFNTLTSQLRGSGAKVLILNIGNGEGDINDYATSLQQVTRESAAPVAWIGYSMGGLIARRAYTADLVPLVSSITSWGSPLQGTKSAALANFANACPTACQQMDPGSEFLGSLPRWPNPPARWVSIYSPDDEVIRPYDSSELDETGVVNIDLGACSPATTPTHSELPANPVVLSLTKANLSGQTVTC